MAKGSRYNPRLSLEQYILLLTRKKTAHALRKRIRYKDLTDAWNVRQSVIGSALSRGIKQYDNLIRKQARLYESLRS
jgi:hypothetical protein